MLQVMSLVALTSLCISSTGGNRRTGTCIFYWLEYRCQVFHEWAGHS